MADLIDHATLPTNLLAYWELEEASGTRADSVGSNDLTDNFTVTQGTGIQGNCGNFAVANTEFLSSTTNPGVGTNEDHSYSFWVKMASTGTAEWPFYSGDGSAPGFGARIETDGKIFTQFGNATDQSKFRTTAAHLTSTTDWYHVVVTCDVSAPATYIYVDGVSVANTNVDVSCTTFVGSANTEIGAAGGGQTFDGLIDEVGVWNKILTQDEIDDLFNSGAGIPYGTPVARRPLMIY